MAAVYELDGSVNDSDDDDLDTSGRRALLSRVKRVAAQNVPTNANPEKVLADENVTEANELDFSQSSFDSEDFNSDPPPKRRRIVTEPERLKWSDNDSANDGELAFKKFKNKKLNARKKLIKSTKRSKAVNTKQRPQSRPTSNQRKPEQIKDNAKRKPEYEDRSSDEELMEDTLPDYLQERKKIFEDRTKRLKQGGLALPPSYDQVEFSDDNHLKDLKERPDFPTLKACAPYQDIQLPYSLGLIPASIAQWLRNYQVKGAQFLHHLFVYQKGGILGDDMGLGKTIQVIAFLTAAYGKTGDERDRKRMRKMRKAGIAYPRTLIICPGTLMLNWKEELYRWGWWHADIYHGTAAQKDAVLSSAQSGHLEIMITTYQTYRLKKEEINMISWDCVVADECHIIKERTSEIAKTMNEVNALCRIGLTGTAIQNNYAELWTLLNWTNPGRFGPMSTWKASICEPLKRGQSHTATNYQLAIARKTAKKLVENLLPQFFLRRMKTLIKDQLPKKSDRIVFCPLTETQASAYENFLENGIVQSIRNSAELCECGSLKKAGWCCHMLLEDGSKWQSWVFPAIATLQKLSNHLAILIPQSNDPLEKQEKDCDMLAIAVPDRWRDLHANRDNIQNFMNPDFCGKWKVLKKLLKLWHDDEVANNKVLVFSHSVRLLKMLQKLFVHTSYNVSYLDGSMKLEDRYTVVNEFNTDPSQFVFLISTKAGGVGLNITSANKVVIVDPNWNPSYDLQAQDRAYRIGQLRDVDVFRLVSQGTLEEIVYARQIYKQQQASIGYHASSERRYFQGVQGRTEQKGEIFGLQNLFAYQYEQVMLKDIVNKTNVAESRADVRIANLDLESDDNDAEDDAERTSFKQEEDEDAAISQLVTDITGDDCPGWKQGRKGLATEGLKQKRDPVLAILASVGIEYTHENSEVIGSSKVEARLSKRAEEAADGESWAIQEKEAKVFLEDGSSLAQFSTLTGVKYQYRPPSDVKKRQFCTMAKWAGYDDVVEFALVVEGWTQTERRDWLGKFYRRRMEIFLGKDDVDRKMKKMQSSEEEKKAIKGRGEQAKVVEIRIESEDDDDEL